MSDAQEIRVSTAEGRSESIRTSYPVGVHRHHITAPIWPHKREVKRDRSDRNLLIATCFAIFWLTFLGICTYESLVSQRQARQDDFDRCRDDRVVGHCPVGYRLSRGIRD